MDRNACVDGWQNIIKPTAFLSEQSETETACLRLVVASTIVHNTIYAAITVSVWQYYHYNTCYSTMATHATLDQTKCKTKSRKPSPTVVKASMSETCQWYQRKSNSRTTTGQDNRLGVHLPRSSQHLEQIQESGCRCASSRIFIVTGIDPQDDPMLRTVL